MCGIAGLLRPSGLVPETDGPLLGRMARILAHRGPDDEGVLLSGCVGLAHRRLSVIETSAAGHQPMTRGQCAIVFNGEIYNYRELRAELEAKGERFVSGSDTEVLLSLLIREGEAGLARVNGMFAFAFWDAGRQELMLARDRIGKKPLYFAQWRGTLIFGSEIKAILEFPGFPRAPDLGAIHHFLSLQYVPAPMTAFDGVSSLRPGTVMFCRPGEKPRITQYWRLAPPERSAGGLPREDLVRMLREHLQASVRRRMVADVPVGAFLSGGVDSSTVTALMSMETGAQVKTFSIGFSEDAYDERRFARLVAQRYATDHHEEEVREDAATILPAIVWHYGQPFADPSAIPTFYLSRLARRSVTVALSGDGGDEFFIGYDRYEACRRREWPERIPGLARGLATALGSGLPRILADRRYVRTLKRLLLLAGSSRAQRYEPAIAYFTHEEKASLYGPGMTDHLGVDTMSTLLGPYLESAHTLMEGAAFADAHTYLPDDILVKVDVATMSVGLEARAPFLDVELMEWASNLPGCVRAGPRGLKSLLKEAVADLLPPEVIQRPKMGFGAPVDVWLRGGFASIARDILLSETARSRGLFRPEAVRSLLDEHMSGRRHHHTRLWALLMVELWFDMWIDNAGDRPGNA